MMRGQQGREIGRALAREGRDLRRRLVQVGEIQAALRRRVEQPLRPPLRICLIRRANGEIGRADHDRTIP